MDGKLTEFDNNHPDPYNYKPGSNGHYEAVNQRLRMIDQANRLDEITSGGGSSRTSSDEGAEISSGSIKARIWLFVLGILILIVGYTAKNHGVSLPVVGSPFMVILIGAAFVIGAIMPGIMIFISFGMSIMFVLNAAHQEDGVLHFSEVPENVWIISFILFVFGIFIYKIARS